MVYAYGVQVQSGYPMDTALEEAQVALHELFGTPDHPRLPAFVSQEEEYADWIRPQHLERAAGPPTQEGMGLYRDHCALCHGVVGNGRGLTAALLDPYPRDYRHGKFKYKSTGLADRPTKADLARVIRNGIAGTSMKPIPELDEADIAALVDYVIYLAWRGELERELLMEGEQIAFEDGEHLFEPTSDDFADQLELVNDYARGIADRWLQAEDNVYPVPAPAEDVVVPPTIEGVLNAATEQPGQIDSDTAAVRASIDKGREIFASERASCAKCHGNQGYGDGQTQDYDDWSKDWTTRIGLDPSDLDGLIPFIARGALPPRKILPRDFREGLFRGGADPEDLYRRIAVGIAGTPMPAAQLEPSEIWHLVNFVRSLTVPPPPQEPQ